MADYIERQAAIDKINERQRTLIYCFGFENDMVKIMDIARSIIIAMPSADVQPRKTAEWVYGEKDGADGWYCSECKFHIPWYYEYYGLNNINFIKDFHTCPHCDAKMLKYTGMEREQNG